VCVLLFPTVHYHMGKVQSVVLSYCFVAATNYLLQQVLCVETVNDILMLISACQIS